MSLEVRRKLCRIWLWTQKLFSHGLTSGCLLCHDALKVTLLYHIYSLAMRVLQVSQSRLEIEPKYWHCALKALVMTSFPAAVEGRGLTLLDHVQYLQVQEKIHVYFQGSPAWWQRSLHGKLGTMYYYDVSVDLNTARLKGGSACREYEATLAFCRFLSEPLVHVYWVISSDVCTFWGLHEKFCIYMYATVTIWYTMISWYIYIYTMRLCVYEGGLFSVTGCHLVPPPESPCGVRLPAHFPLICVGRESSRVSEPGRCSREDWEKGGGEALSLHLAVVKNAV
jgi:hypothetical protein